jgi:hypothetical protein
MDFVLKTVRVFLLFIAGLAITAHAIIPHDHHSADSVSVSGDSCPVSNNKSDHNQGLPVHCHACNDLASEKIVISFLSQKLQYNSLSASNMNLFLSLKTCFESGIVNVICDPLTYTYLAGCSSLRAPPCKV